jgi:hypothetical protein
MNFRHHLLNPFNILIAVLGIILVLSVLEALVH